MKEGLQNSTGSFETNVREIQRNFETHKEKPTNP